MRGLTCALSLLAGAAMAQDYVEVDGPLSDDAFYDLVSCRAAPGQPCRFDRVRWSPDRARGLRIGFAAVDPAYPGELAGHLDRALDLAISSINGIGADLALVRVAKSEEADIRIHLVAFGDGDVLIGTGEPAIDGEILGAALVHVWWDVDGHLTQGIVVMADDIPLPDAYPVLLEEITQGLGLLTDIRAEYYESRSVFSEDSNSVTKHGEQDIMAIRRHYPPQAEP